jgi:peptidoglycan/LPS O-acetylase OafA/YrhL
MPLARSEGYVPEIDGLRTVAVLSVLLYHVGFPLSGGYVGVDVFFVISGYLITRMIRDEVVATGRFDFLRFYVRRVRRLFPALWVTVAVTGLASALLLSPEQMLRFAASAGAALLSVSNLLFWLEADYFDALASTKPLLHTWSLAVEEQFYLVWPALLLLLFLRLGGRGTVAVLALLCIASVALGEYWIPRDPAAAFYLLPTRIAELGIGALLVWAGRFRPGGGPGLEAMLGLGLGLILYAAASFTEKTPFPGVNALVPCLGAALAIQGCRARRLGAALRWPPVVWLGRISYSLYLVHWPVVVLWGAYLYAPFGPADRWGMIAASVALAALQYHFVEERYRHVTAASVSGPRFLFGAASAAAALGLAAGAVVLSNGLPGRIPEDRFVMSNRDQRHAQRDLYCRSRNPALPAELFTCQNFRGKDRDIVLWGDSHALHLVAGFSEWFPEHNVYVLFMPGCNPQSGFAGYVRRYGSRETEACIARNRTALERLESMPPTSVVLSSAKGPPPEVIVPPTREIVARLEAAGHRVAVLGDIVVPGRNLVDCASVPAWLVSDARVAARCTVDPATVAEDLAYNDKLEALMSDLDLVALDDVQCPGGACRFFDKGEVLFRDDHHLTLDGSKLFVGAARDRLPFAAPRAARADAGPRTIDR